MTEEPVFSEEVRRRHEEYTRIGQEAVRRAIEENRRLGIPNCYEHGDQIVYELPDLSVTTEGPFERVYQIWQEHLRAQRAERGQGGSEPGATGSKGGSPPGTTENEGGSRPATADDADTGDAESEYSNSM
ncbi:MAG: hypothetical protein GF330_13845 [Candidatus Eisenbacteria bacterium]|nr:hypothetical protein [Candidatus Eisenbacteria bacterium]